MKLDFIDLGKLCVSKANMRYAKKAPDVSDILPTVRRRGVIVPILVRPAKEGGIFEIIAGARRFHAASLVAQERQAEGAEAEPMPCAILEGGEDADAIEASLIENSARLDPDEVTRWECFTRLVREGRSIEGLSATFGLPELAVKRILALGNLLPRIRDLYRRNQIDAATVRHLTMASKSQQKAWLVLFDDADSYCPTGHQLKAWLFGGKTIPVKHALFDTETMTGIVADLFGEDRYFADSDAFWTAQNEAIAARRAAYLEAGWPDVVTLNPGENFHSWEHEKAPKRKGGRVYVETRGNGEVIFHEGYVTAKEARRIERGEAVGAIDRARRPEVTGTMQTYIDLHRHAALRAALVGHPGLALRIMVAHATVGSSLWSVRVEPQTSRNDATRESVEGSSGEAVFDAARRDVLALLGLDADEPTVVGGRFGGEHRLVVMLSRLMDLDDAQVMQVLGVVMGETLACGSLLVEMVGQHIGLDMAANWQADDAFFEALRDREVLLAMVSDIAGEAVAKANAEEKAKVLKTIIRNSLDGADGRDHCEGWVPRWMTFPASAYTERGGVGPVERVARVAVALSNPDGEEPEEGDENDTEIGGENPADPDGDLDDGEVPLAA